MVFQKNIYERALASEFVTERASACAQRAADIKNFYALRRALATLVYSRLYENRL